MITSTLVQRLFILILLQGIHFFSYAQNTVRVKGDAESQFEKTSAFSLFFNPKDNGIKLDKQKIDYDLTKKTVLRIGPYLLDESVVSMNVTREQGEFYEIDFGLEIRRKIGPIYIASFKWPENYLHNGVIEIIDDNSRSLWRRKVSEQDLTAWKNILTEQDNRELFERNRADLEKSISEDKAKGAVEAIREKLQLAKPRQLSLIHQRSQFGLAHKGFFEIPIASITAPFRFCLSEDNETSRLALCSRRYQFIREAGRYKLQTVSQKVTPKVLINDKPVTLKGTAIFLENDVPIKFSAVLEAGTYFEFVSNPKEVRIVDMISYQEGKQIQVIGYGDTPMGQIDESFYADSVHWGFLNFMPTIGDLRKFWRSSISATAPYLYLKGEGGAPFRQSFDFETLPTEKARVVLSDKTTKSTYRDRVWVSGTVNPEVGVSADDAEVKRLSETEFEWHFPAPKKGVFNTGLLNVHESGKIWKGGYDIYRGYPAEIGLRASGVITSDLQLIILGEIAGQYWFESLLGIDSYYLSQQRWGVSGKYFKALTGTENEKVSDLRQLSVANLDLKYRFTPGIWSRDPTVGAILSYQSLQYSIIDPEDEQPLTFTVPTVGGGVFWARSMPKIFDDFFNILPFMRYPKWVDWEFLLYPLALDAKQKSNFVLAMNFHGKVQWTENFYGEGGFGLKNYSFDDFTSPDENKQFSVPLVVAYGTVGIGFNF